MLFSARIRELEGQLLTVTGERDALATSIADLTAANAENRVRFDANQALILSLTGERDSARAQLLTITGERDTAVAALAAEQASRESAIAAEVTNRIAASGGQPIKRDPAAVAPTEPAATAGGTPASRLAATITING